MSSPPKKIVNFKARLKSDNNTFSGVIENLSEDSLYIRFAPLKTGSDFTPGKLLEVKFQPDSGETICLSCRVKWSYKTPPHGLTNSMGIEIIDPIPNYDEFLKTLS